MKIIWNENTRSNRGQGMCITYGYKHVTPYGRALIGQTNAGICFFGFPQNDQEVEAMEKMRSYFPKATFEEGAVDVGTMIDMHGTPHQVKTWKELMQVNAGQVVSYQELAKRTGNPKAARAAGSAMAANPVCLYIPCHRVVAANGHAHHYAWGVDLKKKMLQEESL